MAERVIKRKKKPMQLAVIDQRGCTGCEACIQFCPVDCILVVPGERNIPGFFQLVEIDLDRCIGCTLCVQHCPWDTIAMIPFEEALHQARQWTIRSVWLDTKPTSQKSLDEETEIPATSVTPS